MKKTAWLFSEDVLQSLQTAEQEYMSQADGKTICEIGKAGHESLQLKAAEGRMQALRDISRILSKTAEDAVRLQQQMQQLDERWQRLSEISASWRAYKAAGLTEIRRIMVSIAQTPD